MARRLFSVMRASTAAPDLIVRIKKHGDGAAALSCTRRDGTVTWQRQGGKLGQFFPPHDLTHFAVETTLRYDHGFYGLVADGWNLTDFGTPWPRGPLPPEAAEVEAVVGFFDLERAMGTRIAPEEFNRQARESLALRDRPPGFAFRDLTEAEIAAVRAARAELLARWAALPPGETLELAFHRAGRSSSLQESHRD